MADSTGNTITIDGRELAYEPGQTVIQIAKANGIELPHYCYHPGLSIAGNCRICMVEVEGWDRPQIGCKLQPSAGMVVRTGSPLALEARRSTMEFLLVNHPLDCPICDQAGECHLQDLSYELGQGKSRSSTEKTQSPKNVPFGANVVYDGERCIKCTRCVRFTEEITGTCELAMGERSDQERVIMTSKGEFETPYAMNIIDICPVGALTSRDFRFQSRLWFMDFVPSICTGCAKGCNVTIGARQGELLRMAPRENAAVNQWWMCDPGRLGYHYANSPSRLTLPRVKDAGGAWRDVTWETAIDAAANALKDATGDVLLDGGLSLEEMHVASALASKLGGAARFAGAVGDDGDDFLIVNEKAANAKGAELLGLARADGPAQAAVLLVERDENVPAGLRDATKATVVFALDGEHVPDSARVVFPLGSWAERDGTLVNVDGLAQEIRRNPGAGPNDLLPCLEVLEEILLALDPQALPHGREGVLEVLAAAPGFEDVLSVPSAERAGAGERVMSPALLTTVTGILPAELFAPSPVLAGAYAWLSQHPDDGGVMLGWVAGRILLVLLIANLVLVSAALLVWAERRVAAWMQDRLGPNRVGPQGLLQPIADLGKFIFKEDYVPGHVSRWLYLIAPMISLVPALVTFAVIPYTGTTAAVTAADGVESTAYASWQIADVNIGVLYLLAITSLGVYGISLGGWSSNGKYSLLGGVRSSAQMISYELSMGLAIVSVVLLASTLRLGSLIEDQAVNGWFLFRQPLAFFIFLVASYAETNRLPFDLPEAEQEIVAGYHTEYSAMKFAAFFLAEYVNMLVASALVTTLFLGGWTLFGLESLGWVMALFIFLGKTFGLCFVFIWVRWTLPRFRYDQLMKLGWAWFLPLALGNVVLTATAIAFDAPWLMLALLLLVFGLVIAALIPSRIRVPTLDERAAATPEEGA